MADLEEIKKEIKQIEEEISNQDVRRLGSLKLQCTKIERKLIYRRKKDQKDLVVKELLNKVRKLKKRITYEFQSIRERVVVRESIIPEVKPSKEMEMLDAILKSGSPKKSKIIEIKYLISTIDTNFDIHTNEIKELRDSNKKVLFEKRILYKALEDVTDTKRNEIENRIQELTNTYREQDIKLKDLASQMNQLQKDLQKCYGALAEVRDLKAKKQQRTEPSVRRQAKKKNYYYHIMEELLTDDRNYFIIKTLIEENPKFKYAIDEEKGISVFWKIVDCLVRDLKMEIAKVHPEVLHVDYYLALYRLFVKDMEIHSDKHEEIKRLLEQDGKSFNPPKVGKEKTDAVSPVDLNELMESEIKNKNRVNLTKDYLTYIGEVVSFYKETHQDEGPGKKERRKKMVQELGFNTHDIQNSFLVQPTIALEGTKYAINIHYDEDYTLYFRVHLLDTSFITKDSYWYQIMEKEMFEESKAMKKLLSFKEEKGYPALTIQFKINNNGEVEKPRVYESIIQIDRIVKNREFLHYREDDVLKSLVGTLRQIATDYNEEIEFMSIPTIEAFIDFLLNIEINRLFEEGHLPSLQYVEVKLSDEDIVDLHGNIYYYLSKIPKTEAYQVWDILHESNKSRFYTKVPLEESEIELDTRTFMGYMHLCLLKLFLRKCLFDDKRLEYKKTMEELGILLNKEDTFVGEELQKKLDKMIKKKEDNHQK